MECLLLASYAGCLAWLIFMLVIDAEPDPQEEEDSWRDYGGEAGGA